MGIRDPYPAQNSLLGFGRSWAEAIMGEARIVHWFRASPANITVDGTDILTFVDIKGTGAYLNRVSTAKCASLTADQFGGLPGALFDRAADDSYQLTDSAMDFDDPYTLAGDCIPSLWAADGSAAANICGKFSSGTAKAHVNLERSAADGPFTGIYAGHGNGATTKIPITPDEAIAYISSWDGATLKLAANGQIVQSMPGAPNAGAGAFMFGALNAAGSQPLEGVARNLFLCDVGALDGSEDGERVRRILAGYLAELSGATP